MAADDESYSYESSYPSPPQEYFPIPVDSKAPEILASFKADIPPVFKANVKGDFYTRNLVKVGKVAQIKNLTRRPDRSVPPNALNTWRDLTPDVKLPDIRHKTLGDIYYTRGKLGQKLHRSKPDYDLSDPVNKRKVLDTQKYSSLHDPHCKNYFRRPSVMKHLRKQKLINERAEVLCDVHEFNQYRSYLGELFNDQVKRRIDDNNAMEDMERGLTKAICAKQQRKQKVADKIYHQAHRKINLEYSEATRKKHLANMKVWQRRLHQIARFRSEIKIATAGMYTMKHWNAYLTRQKAASVEEQRKQHTLIRIAYAETKNDYVTKYDKFVRLALSERYKADQAAALVARDDQIDDMEQLVDETLRRARKSWLSKYDTFIEHCRENPLSHYQLLAKAQLRKKYLMRKYFYRWVNYVLSQRHLRPNEGHRSNFDIDRRLRPFVHSLKDLQQFDFEHDFKKGCGDFECTTPKKHTRVAKLTSSRKDRPIDARNLTKVAATIEDIEGRRASDDFTEKKKRKHKGREEKHEDDGNEADVEEPDDFIDKMVARHKFKQAEFWKNLHNIPAKNAPLIGNRYHVPKQLFTVQIDADLDDDQEAQTETIAFLTDVNRSVTAGEKVKGWKAMKL